jgi:hypothetical protein
MDDALPAVVGALAAGIARECPNDETLGLLAALFTQLGDSLGLIAAARACNQAEESENASV